MTIDERSEIAAAEQEYLDMLAATEIRQACHSAQASTDGWPPGEVTAIDMTANGLPGWVAPSLP